LTVGVVRGSSAALNGQTASRTISGGVPWEPRVAAAPEPALSGLAAPAPFFSSEERDFVDAAAARLIPTDDLGPGANDASVTTFIDRQLAGSFGQATTWYMQGPWADGAPEQGYQSRLTPAQLYRVAINAVNASCRQTFNGKRFAELSTDDQDKVLTGLEKGEIKFDGAQGKTFFDLLLQNTVEGFFSDPIYGGNRDMVGWKLIGFPGARYDYRDYVSKHGEKFPLPPVGLKGRAEWTPHR
jgi:gluconate 2-dehydrogenase gamma chain